MASKVSNGSPPEKRGGVASARENVKPTSATKLTVSILNFRVPSRIANFCRLTRTLPNQPHLRQRLTLLVVKLNLVQ